MWRIPADHAPQCHDRFEPAADRQLAHGHRQLKRSRDAGNQQVIVGAAMRAPGAGRALQQARDDEIIEARGRNGHAPATRRDFPFHDMSWRGCRQR